MHVGSSLLVTGTGDETRALILRMIDLTTSDLLARTDTTSIIWLEMLIPRVSHADLILFSTENEVTILNYLLYMFVSMYVHKNHLS